MTSDHAWPTAIMLGVEVMTASVRTVEYWPRWASAARRSAYRSTSRITDVRGRGYGPAAASPARSDGYRSDTASAGWSLNTTCTPGSGPSSRLPTIAMLWNSSPTEWRAVDTTSSRSPSATPSCRRMASRSPGFAGSVTDFGGARGEALAATHSGGEAP